MRNIMFSTTRGWNPGDEFILFGLKRIFKEVVGPFNTVIYNRHPDIHIGSSMKGFVHVAKHNECYGDLAQFVRIGQLDNSVKYYTDCFCIDLAVCAGTPEWVNKRCINFYEHIIRHNIPFMALGIGAGLPKKIPNFAREVIEKALLITTRMPGIFPQKKCVESPVYDMPCPALFCSTKQKTISYCKTIGLVFALDINQTVRSQNISTETFSYMLDLYNNLLHRYENKYNFKIICHYIDELPVACRQFANKDVLYSYSAEDYVDIYSQCDLVISPRVHGCGISASLGIPSICIAHDERQATTQGFLAEQITKDTAEEEVYSLLEQMINEINMRNLKIKKHKETMFKTYVELVKKHLDFNKISYHPVKHFYKPLHLGEKIILLFKFMIRLFALS